MAARLMPISSRRSSRNCLSIAFASSEYVRMAEKPRKAPRLWELACRLEGDSTAAAGLSASRGATGAGTADAGLGVDAEPLLGAQVDPLPLLA